MPDTLKPTPPLSTPSSRKPWTAPKLQSVDVAERTNKKTVAPSDGFGAHTLS